MVRVSVSSAQKVRVWLSGFSRLSFFRLAVVVVVALPSLWLFYGAFTGKPFSRPRFVLGDGITSANPPKLQSVAQTHKNVVVASTFVAHFDVYMAVAWTLQRIMLKESGNVQVYASTPFLFNFQEVVDRYGLYKGEVKAPNDLLGDIKSGGDDGGIDLVIFGTCEFEYVLSSSHSAYIAPMFLFLSCSMPYWSEELLVAWDARDAAHKFEIVCIVHNAGDVRWQSAIPEWSRRNAIRLLPISEQ